MRKARRRARHDDIERADGAWRDFREWQEKQYLPGYWVGGKVPPILLGKRPNRFGYVLLAIGVLSGFGLSLSLLSGAGYDLGATAFNLVLTALFLLAGATLLRKPRRE